MAVPLSKPFVFDRNLQGMLLPLLITCIAATILLLGRSLAFRAFAKWLKQNETDLRATIARIIRTPSIAWCLAFGLYVGLLASDLPARIVKDFYEGINVILILSLTLVIANISAAVFRNFMQSSDKHRTTGLAIGVIRGSIHVIGFLVILSAMGISVAPLLTALGVGGLAVALALKDTLENLFAGIYLVTDRAIRIGDYIKLESGQEGTIYDIGWRTTKITTSNSNTVILPNSKLAQAVVVNYSLPDSRLCSSIRLPLSQLAEPIQVETLLLDLTTKAVDEIEGLLATPEPSVRFLGGFMEGYLEFTLYFYVRHFTEQSFVAHELRKRIFQALQQSGVPLMPFPATIARPA